MNKNRNSSNNKKSIRLLSLNATKKVDHSSSLPKQVNSQKEVTSSFTQANVKPSIIINNISDEPNLENIIGFNKNFICCKESRIESPTSFYSCFYLGPFDESLAQTLAHNLRRTLLSELTGLAITAVEIDKVLHQFSSLTGTKETVLDLLSNLQNIVLQNDFNSKNTFENSQPLLFDPILKLTSLSQNYASINEISTIETNFANKSSNFKNLSQRAKLKTKTAQKLGEAEPRSFQLCRPANGITQIAYLRVRGPGVVKASDIILPSGVRSVNPDQYIATLSEDGILNMKLYINEGKNAIKQNQNSNLNNKVDPHFVLPNNKPLTKKSNKIFLDSVFMPVTKVNAFVETNFKATDAFELSKMENKDFALLGKNNNILTGKSGTQTDRYKFTLNNKNISENQKQSAKHNFLMLKESNSANDNYVPGSQSSVSVNSLSGVNIINQNIANRIAEGPFCMSNPRSQAHIVLEIWTNGSIHPRQALKSCLDFLTTTFMTLNNVKVLGSMYKSDLTYKKILKSQEELS